MKTPVYTCHPVQKKKSLTALCFLCIVLSVVLFYLSGILPALRSTGQFLSALPLILAVQITTKFLLTQQHYHLENNTLFLTATTGKKTRSFGSIPLSKEVRLYTKDRWKDLSDEIFVFQSFSCQQNLFPENLYFLCFPEENRFFVLIFEPDETLCSLLKEIVTVP